MSTPNSRKRFSGLTISSDADSGNVVCCGIRLVGGINSLDPKDKGFDAGTIPWLVPKPRLSWTQSSIIKLDGEKIRHGT